MPTLCKFVIADGVAFCPRCGKSYTTQETNPKRVRAACKPKLASGGAGEESGGVGREKTAAANPPALDGAAGVLSRLATNTGPSIAPILNECIHRGPQLTVAATTSTAPAGSPPAPPALRFEQCQLCGGQDRIVPIHACAVFGECSVAKFDKRQTMACCRGCEKAATSATTPTPEPTS